MMIFDYRLLKASALNRWRFMKFLLLAISMSFFSAYSSSYTFCTSQANITYSILLKYQAIVSGSNHNPEYKNRLIERVNFSNKVIYIDNIKHIQYRAKAKGFAMIINMSLEGKSFGSGYIIDGERGKEHVVCRR